MKIPRFIRAPSLRLTSILLGLAGAAWSGHAADPTHSPPLPENRFITVQGIKLHYLDWGGQGQPLLLLAGLGDDARIFRKFAAALTNDFRVLALTRRGFGKSDKPADGYDLTTRVEDIRGFLAALRIEKAHVAGHSIAGDELTALAMRHPQVINKLVYLDAASDRSTNGIHNSSQLSRGGPNEFAGAPPFFRRLMLESRGDPAASQVEVTNMPPPEIWRAFKGTLQASWGFKPEYGRIQAPFLALFGLKPPPIPPDADDATRREIQEHIEEHLKKRRDYIAELRRTAPRATIVELEKTGHYLFLGSQWEEVTRRVREFLLD